MTTPLSRARLGILVGGLAAVGLLLPGCGPEAPASSEPNAPANPESGPPIAAKKPPTPKNVFHPPAPDGAGDDPRVAAAASASDGIAKSLGVIQQRLKDLKEAYDLKAETERDLRAVAEQMAPLLAGAREDCDALLRAAKDLRTQLPLATAGYVSAGLSYRQRADSYSDPDFKGLNLQLAEQFERYAADVPRRIELTDTFVKELERVQVFLAEADRCLRDAATALAVFSAGGHEPKTSFEGRMFRQRLEEFMSVVAAYEKKLIGKKEGGSTAPGPTTSRVGEEDGQELSSATERPATAPGRRSGVRQAPAESGFLPMTPEVLLQQAATRALLGQSDPTAPKRRSGIRKKSLESVQLPDSPDIRARIAARDAALRRSDPQPTVELVSETLFTPTPSLRTASYSELRPSPERFEFPVGGRLTGFLSTPARGFHSRVSLRIAARLGDDFTGLMEYGEGPTAGRRGVRGRIAPDGASLTMSADWFQGNVSSESIQYDLAENSRGYAGSWRTATLQGTIRLVPE